MTPKKKAEELIDKFLPSMKWSNPIYRREEAKQCVLICVDEILKELDNCDCYNQIAHYKEVKKEIEKL
jgi:hypothetical protein